MPYFALVGHAKAGDVEGKEAGLRYPVLAMIEAANLDDAGERAYALLAEVGWENLFVRRGKSLDITSDYSEHEHAAQLDQMVETGSSFLIYSDPILD